MTSALEAEKKGNQYGVLWQLDDDVTHCRSCNCQFNQIFTRKHHCRFCGLIFCASCTPENMVHPRTSTGERACQICTQKYACPLPSPLGLLADTPGVGNAIEKRPSLVQQGATLVGQQTQKDQSSEVLSARFGVHWREDSDRSGCAACSIEFDSLVRRHHCRHCGDLFCQSCSAQQVIHAVTSTAERACQACVSMQRVRQATVVEIRSGRFMARAATSLVSVLVVSVGVLSGSARAVVFGLLGTLFANSFVFARWWAIQHDTTFEAALGDLVKEAGGGALPEQIPTTINTDEVLAWSFESVAVTLKYVERELTNLLHSDSQTGVD